MKDSILMKPGKLSPNEYEYMKSHTTRGTEILKTSKMHGMKNTANQVMKSVADIMSGMMGKGIPTD